jgi:hypothetical protein
MKRRLVWFLAIFLVFAPGLHPVAAQAGVDVKQVQVEYVFGNYILLEGRLEGETNVTQVSAFLQASGENASIPVAVSLDSSGALSGKHEIARAGLRPFAEVSFWFRFSFADGSTADSQKFSFTYSDNRFHWKTLESDGIRVHWYEGDDRFGQDALDAARAGRDRIRSLLAIASSQPIDIYIYQNSSDLQDTLLQGGQAWVGGHASPELRLALVSAAPGPEQTAILERKIPHELAHILTYDLVGERYMRVPIWLREGVATLSETYPSPDYPRSLEVAVQNNALLPFSSLCGDFPADASSRFLAYAQSDSFTRYLVDEYGLSGLNKLLLAYSDGLGCEQGPQRALGVSLTQLEYAWRAEKLGENRLQVAVQNLSGYLTALALLLLLPFAPLLYTSHPKHD